MSDQFQCWEHLKWRQTQTTISVLLAFLCLSVQQYSCWLAGIGLSNNRYLSENNSDIINITIPNNAIYCIKILTAKSQIKTPTKIQRTNSLPSVPHMGSRIGQWDGGLTESNESYKTPKETTLYFIYHYIFLITYCWY